MVRRIFATLFLGFASLLLLSAGTMQALNALAGNPGTAIDTVLAVAQSPKGAHALASKLVDQLGKDAGDAERPAFLAHRDALITAVQGVMEDPATKVLVRADLLAAYNAVNTGQKTVIDLRPVVFKFTRAMHNVDPRIPATPNDLKHPTVKIDNHNTAVKFADQLTLTAWGLTLGGMVLASVIAWFMVKNKTRKVIAIGLAVGIPSLLLLGAGISASSIPNKITFDDANVKIFATQLAHRIGNAITMTALIFLGITLLLIGLFLLLNQRGRGRAGIAPDDPMVLNPTPPAPPQAPTPPVSSGVLVDDPQESSPPNA
ncbi:MAG: hypothetical protein WCL38_04515 [Actinomycetota bacterium]